MKNGVGTLSRVIDFLSARSTISNNINYTLQMKIDFFFSLTRCSPLERDHTPKIYFRVPKASFQSSISCFNIRSNEIFKQCQREEKNDNYHCNRRTAMDTQVEGIHSFFFHSLFLHFPRAIIGHFSRVILFAIILYSKIIFSVC